MIVGSLALVLLTASGPPAGRCTSHVFAISKQIQSALAHDAYHDASRMAERIAVIAESCPEMREQPPGLFVDLAGVNSLRAGEYAYFAGELARARGLVAQARSELEDVKDEPSAPAMRLVIAAEIKEANADLAGHWPKPPPKVNWKRFK